MPICRPSAFPHLLAACCAALLAWSATALATPGQIYEVTRPEINLRAAPNTDAKVIGHLPEGARLMEFARKGRWFKVKEMGRVGPEGWVYGALIAPEKLDEPAPSAPPPAAKAPAAGPPADAGGEVGSSGGDGRAILPWAVMVPPKARRHKGKRRHRHRGRPGKPGITVRPVRPGLRDLGWPRTSGAPNLGTLN